MVWARSHFDWGLRGIRVWQAEVVARFAVAPLSRQLGNGLAGDDASQSRPSLVGRPSAFYPVEHPILSNQLGNGQREIPIDPRAGPSTQF